MKMLLATLAAVPLLSAGDPPRAAATQPQAAPARQYSRETLDRIRKSLPAQIAVHDAAEGLMRAPTAEEASALANSAPGAASTVALQNGGAALRSDFSQLSFVVARIDADGKARIDHAPASPASSAASSTKQGAANGR